MFGMEKQKKGKKQQSKQDMFFDLENSIATNPSFYKELKDKINVRVNNMKAKLRSGSEKENFDKYGILLHGYASLHKVITKVHKKEHKK
jgi:hypothetical protein